MSKSPRTRETVLRIWAVLALSAGLFACTTGEDSTGAPPARTDPVDPDGRDNGDPRVDDKDGYYKTVDPSSPQALRASLHDIIDDHISFPYSSSREMDTWDVLELADQDTNRDSHIVTVYGNGSFPKEGGGNNFYDREHVWPRSYGFPEKGDENHPFSDCHALRLSDKRYNGARGNKLFGNCEGTCEEFAAEGGGENFSGSTWEVWEGRRGDIARTMFYLDVRYEGGSREGAGAEEPDLVLTDDPELVVSSRENQPVAHMGLLSVLLDWNQEDPVDDRERARNEVVYQFQGNRNPFVDHPAWAECIFSGDCP